MALLAIGLEYFQYKYFIGSLSTEIYTGIIAVLFTALGIWIASLIINKSKNSSSKVHEGEMELNTQMLKELNLNEREYEVLGLIAKGLTNQEIADQLYLALPTIKTHTSNLYSKLDVKNRTQAVHKARDLKLI